MVKMPKRILEATAEKDRAQQRKQLGSLKDLTVQPVTRARYKEARDNFYQWLRQENLSMPTSPYQLDLTVSDYLEALWATGKVRSVGSNTLASLQDVQPHLKRKLKMSWRLMKARVANELPNRAPPLPLDALRLYCLFKSWPQMALSLLLAYHGLFRTGELLALKAKNVAISSAKGPAVVSLGLTKPGKRHGAAESVTIHEEEICRRLFQWKNTVPPLSSLTGPSHKWRRLFAQILTAVNLDQFDFRPYSLGRGGATNHCAIYSRFDTLMVLGRWHAAAAACLYLNESLSVLTEITIPWNKFTRNLRGQYISSLAKALPKLERTRSSRSTGDVGKARKRTQKSAQGVPKKECSSQ